MNDRVDAYFERLRGKRAVVLGIGVSNRPLIRMLLEYGAEVTACDKTPREKLDEEVLALERLGARLHVGEDYLEGLEADVVFRTPGMRPDLPQIRRLTEGGAQLTSEMEAFFEVCPCTRIAVTGSDGKTTTTTLIAKILEHAGKKVWIGGNIGQPLLPLAKEMSPEDFAVVELSSFQLMTMTSSAEVAVVTNLAPNHLDVHKSMEEYIAAKENVYLHQSPSGKLVVNMDNAITHSFVGKAKGRVEEFSRFGIPENGVHLQDGTIYRNGKKIMDAADIRIPGVTILRTTWRRPARSRASRRTRTSTPWRAASAVWNTASSWCASWTVCAITTTPSPAAPRAPSRGCTASTAGSF